MDIELTEEQESVLMGELVESDAWWKSVDKQVKGIIPNLNVITCTDHPMNPATINVYTESGDAEWQNYYFPLAKAFYPMDSYPRESLEKFRLELLRITVMMEEEISKQKKADILRWEKVKP